MDNISGHCNFKGVDIAELCEEFGELDLKKRESASGNDRDCVLQAIAGFNSVESDTEDGKIPFTALNPYLHNGISLPNHLEWSILNFTITRFSFSIKSTFLLCIHRCS